MSDTQTTTSPLIEEAARKHEDHAASGATMRAAVLQSPGNMTVEIVPIPQPKSGEVRVKLEGCGVCASNLSPWKGEEWFSYPFSPGQLGHEAWGIIDAVGEGVGEYSRGERVAMLSNNAYAEYDVAPIESIIRLPQELDGVAFPAEPLGCAINIWKRCGVREGDTVAIIGIGFLGAILTQFAVRSGARVIAVSRREYSLQVAREMGAQETIRMDDHWRIIERVKELTDGVLCDVVIEAVGKQWPLDLATELMRERGRLIIAGYHQDGPRQVNMQQWNWRGLDVINAHERDPQVYMDGVAEAAQQVARGEFDVAPLLTHRFPLEELGVALDATRDRPDCFMKAIITL